MWPQYTPNNHHIQSRGRNLKLKEKTNAIALNFKSQFIQENDIVDYDTEREVNETVRKF